MSVYDTHYGFIDDEYKPDVPYFLSISDIKAGGWVLLLFILCYLWYGLILVKFAYLNPVLEDICEIFDEKKSYITKAFFYFFYQNMDLMVIMFFACSLDAIDVSVYSL